MRYLKYFALLFVLFGLVLVAARVKVPSEKKVIEMPARQLKEPRWRFYETTNIYTRLLLDTQTGRLWQQHTAGGTNEEMARYVIVDKTLLPDGVPAVEGRFSLYSTGNMYNFVLLDQVDGRTWQIQWSYDEQKRGIISELPAPIGD
jgi:hypothetical protein